MIILLMVILSAGTVISAIIYYGNLNSSEDPRVKLAQTMYGRYNRYVSENDSDKVLALLDSIENVYGGIPHYQQSFEIGVLHNNRASVFLTRALNAASQNQRKDHYFALAEKYIQMSIDNYRAWMDQYGELGEEQIKVIVQRAFGSDKQLMKNDQLDAIIRNRVDDMLLAKKEMPRRLSVSYTNLGIIRRHDNQPEEALKLYNKALKLWSENHAARNNANIILGKPLEKQSILRKLFPPDKNNH
jgi:tetratricopeptide (TPR) repeat protein